MATSATSDSIRGMTIHNLYIDECAFIRRDTFDEFMKVVIPSMPKESSKIIIGSTPHGHNHFHKMFVDALTQYSDFRHVTLKYDAVPNRTEAWRQKEIACIGLNRFKSEYDCEFIDITKDENRSFGDLGGFRYAI